VSQPVVLCKDKIPNPRVLKRLGQRTFYESIKVETQMLLGIFQEKAKALRVKTTAQRLAVYRELASRKDHPTVEEIYQALEKEMPSLYFATVYRTLRYLEEMGLVKRAPMVYERMRYEVEMEPHAHFVCRKCGAIMDVSLVCQDCHELQQWVEKEVVELEEGQLNLCDLCKACREYGPGGPGPVFIAGIFPFPGLLLEPGGLLRVPLRR